MDLNLLNSEIRYHKSAIEKLHYSNIPKYILKAKLYDF